MPADVDSNPGLDPAADAEVADSTTATQLFSGKSGAFAYATVRLDSKLNI